MIVTTATSNCGLPTSPFRLVVYPNWTFIFRVGNRILELGIEVGDKPYIWPSELSVIFENTYICIL